MPDKPRVEVCFRHRLGSLSLDVDFKTSAPWTLLFGASGSGKSTILRVIAGLIRPDKGRIVLDGEVCFDSAAKVWIPAHRRKMRWAGQEAKLLPGTLQQNLVRGIKGSRKARVAEIERAARHFDLGLIGRYLPSELSGGQRQRVSVIRAAAGARGMLLLLDEPFAGLDAMVRDRLIAELRSWLGDTPAISVTHDVGEAFLLDAEVVRIAEGRVVAQGPVLPVLAEERRRLIEVLG